MSPVSPSLPTINLSMGKPLHQVRRERAPCPALPWPGRANPAKVRVSHTQLDSTRLDSPGDWTDWTDLTDGQTGSPPDWFIRSASPTKGPTLAHQSLPAGHGDWDWDGDGDWDWDWGSWLWKGRGRGGICKSFYTFLHSPALCCTSPPGRAGSLPG